MLERVGGVVCRSGSLIRDECFGMEGGEREGDGEGLVMGWDRGGVDVEFSARHSCSRIERWVCAGVQEVSGSIMEVSPAERRVRSGYFEHSFCRPAKKSRMSISKDISPLPPC